MISTHLVIQESICAEVVGIVGAFWCCSIQFRHPSGTGFANISIQCVWWLCYSILCCHSFLFLPNSLSSNASTCRSQDLGQKNLRDCTFLIQHNRLSV